ncbi:MAG: hypothetical protein ACLPOQ_02825, partial [Desulfobaccales bacterium]
GLSPLRNTIKNVSGKIRGSWPNGQEFPESIRRQGPVDEASPGTWRIFDPETQTPAYLIQHLSGLPIENPAVLGYSILLFPNSCLSKANTRGNPDLSFPAN